MGMEMDKKGECGSCQDGRAVQGAAFRSQSTSVGVGSNPTPDSENDLFTLLMRGDDVWHVWNTRWRDRRRTWIGEMSADERGREGERGRKGRRGRRGRRRLWKRMVDSRAVIV